MGEYFAELDERFPTGFDADAARDEDDEAAALAPPGGGFVVIRTDLEPIGCGGLQRVDDATGEIKRMWIHPDWRGLGLGRRLVDHLEHLAAELGYGRVVLDTNDSLEEAIAMYGAMGYDADRALQRQSLRPALVRQAAGPEQTGLRQPVRNGSPGSRES